jgi:hypothetical protein
MCYRNFPFFHGIYTVKLEAVLSSEAEINFCRTKTRHILEQWNPQLGAFRLIVTSRVAISEAFKVDFFVQGQEKLISQPESHKLIMCSFCLGRHSNYHLVAQIVLIFILYLLTCTHTTAAFSLYSGLGVSLPGCKIATA